MSYTGNLGWLYYKGYYQDLDFLAGKSEGNDALLKQNSELLKKRNSELLRARIPAAPHPMLSQPTVQSIYFETTYPGLLMGSGYNHEAIRADEEFKVGFSFDHTTGLPMLPGSSLKGILRSMFPGADEARSRCDDKDEARRYSDIATAKRSFIGEMLRSIRPQGPVVDVLSLEKEIFGSVAKDKEFVVGRDCFLGGFMTGPSGAHFVGSDYITPHKSPIENPIPVRFLKVLPAVQFALVFELKPGLLTVAEKLRLFEAIIAFKGLGAKTNVGYGNVKILASNPS